MPNGSRLIIALDPPLRVGEACKWAMKIIEETRDYAVGYEIGLPFLVRCGGIDRLKEVIEAMGGVEYRIADLKLADIADMMIMAVDPLLNIGFNAFTAHSFIGLEGGLRELGAYLEQGNAKLITIVSMSHGGGMDILDKYLDRLVDVAIKAGSWGLVAPATRPWMIRKLRRLLDTHGWRHIKILAPGIGVQGGIPGDALRSGADYEIVGRLITYDADPRSKAREINSIHSRILEAHEGWR